MMSTPEENPYPGLRSFGIEEQHLFFGREEHVNDLLEKLRLHHFVAIVGNSGSGKSSLVKAGLIPRLQNGALLQNGSDWLVLSIHPGSTPLLNLAEGLSSAHLFGKNYNRHSTELYSEFLQILSEDKLGLIEVTRKELPVGKKLLILLDQFEEIFRFQEESMDERNREAEVFIKLIIEAIHQRDVPIYVVMTVRSDFLGDCTQFEGLPEAINDGHYLVPRLNKEQIKRAITGPVDYAMGKIAPRLTHRVLEDLGDNPDQLPILQHALMRSWETWKRTSSAGEPMDIRHYEMTGGMVRALSTHADEAFNELHDDAQRDLAIQVLKCLTMKASDNRGIRRPNSIHSLCEITEAQPDEILMVLKPFRKKGRTFILPDESFVAVRGTIMDISHESLMRTWNSLRSWVDEEADAAALYERLCMSAELYKQGKAALWRDPELQVALDWMKKNNPNKAWSEMYNSGYETAISFLEQSRNERTLELKRKRRRKFISNAAITTFLIVVSLLSFWALMQTRKAQEKSAEALAQRDHAEQSSKAAALSEEKASQSADLAQLNAFEADSARKEAERQRKSAIENESKATQNLFIAETRKRQEEEQRRNAETQNKIAQSEREKALKLADQLSRSRMLELAQALASKVQNKYDDPQLPGLFALQSYLFHARNGGSTFDPVIYAGLYSVNGQVNKEFTNVIGKGKSELIAVSASFFENKVNSVSLNGTVNTFSIQGNTSSLLRSVTLPGNKIYSCAIINPTGRFLITGTDDNEIHLWTLGTEPRMPVILNGHKQGLRTAAFSADGKWLATTSRDNTLLLWDLSKISMGAVRAIGTETSVRNLCFSPNSSLLVAGGDDGKIYTFDTQNFHSKILYSHPNKCSALAFDPDGSQVVCGYKNGKIFLVNVSTDNVKELKGSSAAVDALCFNNAGTLLAVSSADEIIRLFSLENVERKPILLSDHHAKSKHIAFGKDDKIFATCEFSLRYWETSTETLFQSLLPMIKRNLSRAEWNTFIGSDIPYEKTVLRFPEGE